ncbi:hypothetical protein AKJ09_11518 [Labilithrix luteola]|uniref:Uncharacterized protein n=1 Tax=Labilithrix luteola TaxID=1391654 RepID=A0A0K1QHD3_9BACT|nr:hypothetical protein [Labilithrix luteola]AKV04855.1 hypothetical protein AKJ09_11518 [Labilithrix luteola]
MNRFSAALANEEIDPDRMWHNASTVTKVRWTLARMLGAVQQGALHLPSNQIAEQLDAMARADVDAQKANYEHKRGRLNDMRNMYSMAMEQTRNRDEAERLAHGYAITALQTQVQTVAEASQSDIVKAQAAKLDAELELRKVDRGNHENRWVPTQTSEAPNAFGLTAKDRSELLKHALTKQIDANAKHKDDKSDIQATITEQNKQFDNILNSDVLKKTGWLTGIANSTGFQRLMPESSQNAVAVDGINQQVLGSVGKQLKDSEGRIAPPVLEALHKLAVNPYDTEAVARKKVQMAKDFVNSVALQSGALVAIRPFEHVEDFTKAGVTLPGIAARAEGGPVAQGQPVLVGERGPEMVLPMGTPVAAPAPFDVGPEVPLYTQDGKRLNGRPDGVTTRERPAPAAAADIELTDEDSLPVYGANGKQLQERPLQDDRKGVPMSVPAQERLNRTRAAAARWAEPFRKTAPYRGDVEALSQPDHHEEIRKTILAAQRTRSSIKRRRSSSARPGPSS